MVDAFSNRVPFVNGAGTSDPRAIAACDIYAARDQRAVTHFAPLTRVRTTTKRYKQLWETLERDLRRFDFESDTRFLLLRMPSLAHDFFSNLLAQILQNRLASIANEGGDAGKFASKVASGGSSRIFLEEGDLEVPVRRQPDAQFQHNDTA